MEQLIGHSYTKADRYNIPLIVSVPGKIPHQTITKVGGQLDFLPTLTNLLGIPIDHKLVHFGQDLLNTHSNTVGMRYYMPEGSFINQSIIYEPDKSFADGTAINRLTGADANFKGYHSEYEKVIHLENLSDAYIQSLPVRPDSAKLKK
jgi:phosphoglycerol transferase MdoB-like AlkP superfamily enzyme